MAMSDEDKQARIRELVREHQGQDDPDALASELDKVMLTQPSQGAADSIWKFLVGGSVVAIVLVVAGVVYLSSQDKETAELVALGTGLIGGFFGLLAGENAS